jgi:hypothetical protein
MINQKTDGDHQRAQNSHSGQCFKKGALYGGFFARFFRASLFSGWFSFSHLGVIMGGAVFLQSVLAERIQ